MSLPRIICIVGPTASGKTALSITLAKHLGNAEIISADSRQVYRGLDLGTGKVTTAEMDGIPHHLLDVADPSEVYTASDFVRDGRRAIADILSRGNVPMVVGGTGFYIDTLVGKMTIPEVPPNEVLRAELEQKTAEALFAELSEVDPERAATIDSANPRRLVRALEIAAALGKNPPLVSAPLYDILWIGIDPGVEVLDAKIRTRVDSRMQEGMLEEMTSIHEQGLSYERMEDLGLEYRAFAHHLRDQVPLAETLDELTHEIRLYSRRQRTWFRKNKDIQWVRNAEEAIAATKNFLEK